MSALPQHRLELWRRARNVLAVRLDSLGDVLMTTPAIRAIKEAEPGRTVTLLTSSAAVPVAELVPEIDDVIPYDAPWMSGAPLRSSAKDRRAVASIRAGRFDAAVVFTAFSQSPLPAAFLCQLSDVPLRLAHSRDKAYALLTDRVEEPEPDQLIRHEVRRQLDLVGAVGCGTSDESLSFRFGDVALQSVQAALACAGIGEGSWWAAIHPGARAPSRRYPATSFARAADVLVSRGWQVVFTGAPKERDLIEDIRREMTSRSATLAGSLSLEELGALLHAAPVLISCNSGPAHIAAAVGTPVVDLYALTNPQHAPWGVPNRLLYHDVPCRFCYSSVCPLEHHACLELVRPEEVADAAEDLVWNAADRQPAATGVVP